MWRPIDHSVYPSSISLNTALFDFLKRAPVDEFAEQLALDLAQRYEPALEISATKKRNPQRLAKAFDSTFNRAVQFQQNQSRRVATGVAMRVANFA